MDEPVFVIHGVGNREPEAFAATVAALAAGSEQALVPVYWGDLGADDRFLDLALPSLSGPGSEVREAPGSDMRDAPGAGDEESAAVLAALLADTAPGRPDLLPAELREAVRAGMDEAAEQDGGLRDGPGETDEVLAALAEEWPDTTWLSLTDDPALLAEAGAAIARSVADGQEADDSLAGLRGGVTGHRTGEAVRSLVRRRLADLDRVAGAAMQAVAGRVNHGLRSRFAPGATRFLGDVLVYQRHRAQIHARVREVIAAVDPRLGCSQDRPVRVVAHSLGGVIAVDMATAQEPLWTSSLLTFGSQSAYFHLCDPRGGRLAPYAGGEPVTLPPSLAGWTNLWQPLDVLAFAAAGLFRLADGTPPVDRRLAHTASAGLWTHSVYWDLPELAAVIGETMAPRPASPAAPTPPSASTPASA